MEVCMTVGKAFEDFGHDLKVAAEDVDHAFVKVFVTLFGLQQWQAFAQAAEALFKGLIYMTPLHKLNGSETMPECSEGLRRYIGSGGDTYDAVGELNGSTNGLTYAHGSNTSRCQKDGYDTKNPLVSLFCTALRHCFGTGSIAVLSQRKQPRLWLSLEAL
jgi:hypothetical protein